MSEKEVEINILIPVEEEPAVFKPDTRSGPGLSDRIGQTSQRVGGALQTAWENRRTEEAAEHLRAGATRVVNTTRTAAQKAATSHAAKRARVEVKAFPERARRGLVRGLRWTSARLAALAARLGD